MKPSYQVPMWARVLAGLVVLLACLAAIGAVVRAVDEGLWPVSMGDVPALLLNAGMTWLFAWVAATGRVPRGRY